MGQKLQLDNYIGKKFGRLKILSVERIEPRIIKTTNKQNGWIYYVNCKCECGNKCVKTFDSLCHNPNSSCGCYGKELRAQRLAEKLKDEGFSSIKQKRRLYNIHKNMIDRCYNPKCSVYNYYGARGIDVCVEWRDSEGFINFKRWALTNGYADNLEIDRKENNQGYSPENCRWATRKEQMRNVRRNKLISYQGEIKTLSEWCEILNLDYPTILARLDKLKMPVEIAFTLKHHEQYHTNKGSFHPIVLDNMAFETIKICCENYLHQTTGSFSHYLLGTKPMPDKWKNRGLRNYDPEADKNLPWFNG